MIRIAREFFRFAALISLIQTLHAISKDEYNQKTSAIKSKPEIAQFLKVNDYMLSQYGVFFDKLADIFTHIRKTEVGKKTMDHIGENAETILKQGRTYKFIKSIVEAAEKVLTSEVGLKNLFAVANFIQDELRIPNLFGMCIFLKKIIIYLLTSENALTSLVMIKENNFSLEHSPNTAPLLTILDKDFPILTLPPVKKESEAEIEKKKNVSPMKSFMKGLMRKIACS